MDQRQLEAWVKSSRQEPLPRGVNEYLFGTLGRWPTLQVTTAARAAGHLARLGVHLVARAAVRTRFAAPQPQRVACRSGAAGGCGDRCARFAVLAGQGAVLGLLVALAAAAWVWFTSGRAFFLTARQHHGDTASRDSFNPVSSGAAGTQFPHHLDSASRRRGHGGPAMRSAACWPTAAAVLAWAACSAVSLSIAAQVPEPLVYRRVYVPADTLTNQIRGLLPLKRDEFEGRLATARDRTIEPPARPGFESSKQRFPRPAGRQPPEWRKGRAGDRRERPGPLVFGYSSRATWPSFCCVAIERPRPAIFGADQAGTLRCLVDGVGR